MNLLQPQDRKARSAGDSKTAVAARARLLARGIGGSIVDSVVTRAAALPLGAHPLVVDLGSGSGAALGTLATRRAIDGVGIDLSTTAIEQAARQFPRLTWVVANADRRLPLLDSRVSLLLSLHGRRNPAECARVLTADGFVLIAVPAADDLIELRVAVQGRGVERNRAATLIQEFDPFLTLVERGIVRERHRLEHEALRDLLRGTYRGVRTSAIGPVEALGTLAVTLASEVFLFAPRPRPSSAPLKVY